MTAASCALGSDRSRQEEILLKEARPTVLDAAMVETAAYVLERTGAAG